MSSFTMKASVLKKLQELEWENQFALIEVTANEIEQPKNGPMNEPIDIPNTNDALMSADSLIIAII